MGYDGAGNYNRERNFSADASASIKILASAMDQEIDDIASAMTLPWLRDGQNQPTANIPMGGFRLVNVGGPTSASNYMRPSDYIGNVPIYMVDATTSADNISVSASYFTTASAGEAPSEGTKVIIKAASNKGSVPAFHLNTGDGNPYSANVVLNNGSALYSGAIYSGGIYELVYASAASVWHLMNPSLLEGTNDPRFNWASASVGAAGLVEIATTAEASAATDTFRSITPATLDAIVRASGTFTGTFTGFTSNPTPTIAWNRSGDVITLSLNAGSTGTSNSTGFTMTGVPDGLRPTTSNNYWTRVQDNGTNSLGVASINSTGVVTFGLGATGGTFTASGTKGLPGGWTLMYTLN